MKMQKNRYFRYIPIVNLEYSMGMVKIGLIGFGNVGQSVVSILEKNATLLEQRTGQAIRVKRIVVRNIEKYKPLLPDSIDRKSTRLNSSHSQQSRMPSSA